MCKGFKYKPKNYQPGYPVIKNGKYRTSSCYLSQPPIPSNQYPASYSLDNTIVWHLSNDRSNGSKDIKTKTLQDIIFSNKNIPIEVTEATSNNINNIIKSITTKETDWVSWKHNYYYPLLDNDFDDDLYEKIYYNNDFQQYDRSLFKIIEETEETMSSVNPSNSGMEVDGKGSEKRKKDETDAPDNPADAKRTGATTRSKSSVASIKKSIGNFVSSTKKLATNKSSVTATSNQATSTSNIKQILNTKGPEYDTSLDVSTKYIPRKMPNFTSIITYNKEDEDEDNDADVEQDLSMVIKIDRRKQKHLGVDNRRLFVAISKALQHFAPELKVALRNSEDDLDDFDATPKDEELLLEKYIENPTTSKNYIYSVKYHYRTYIPFHRIMRKNDELKRWLKTEGISLELNNIKAVNLENVGFYIKCNPRVSILDTQIERIKLSLPEVTPEFLATVTQVWNEGNHCTVIMIRSGNTEVKELSQLLKTDIDVESYRYIDWGYWDSLAGKFKNSIILTQQEHLNKYATIVLKGFNDDDEIKMNHNIEISTIPEDWKELGELTVTEYLCQYYKTASGDPLIEGCYSPSLGVRELLILRSRFRECVRWAKLVKAEIYNLLSPVARSKIFSNPDQIAIMANKHLEKWSGNMLELEFSPVELEPNNKRNYKKTKYNGGNNTRSYAQAVQNNNSISNNTKPTSNNNHNSVVANHQSAVINEMQTQIKDMKLQNQEYAMELSYVKSSISNNNQEIKALRVDFNESIEKLANYTNAKIGEVHTMASTTHNLVSILTAQNVEMQKMMIQQGNNMQAYFERGGNKENGNPNPIPGGNPNACGQGAPLGNSTNL